MRLPPTPHLPPRFRRHLATAMITKRPRIATPNEPVREARGEYRSEKVKPMRRSSESSRQEFDMGRENDASGVWWARGLES